MVAVVQQTDTEALLTRKPSVTSHNKYIILDTLNLNYKSSSGSKIQKLSLCEAKEIQPQHKTVTKSRSYKLSNMLNSLAIAHF